MLTKVFRDGHKEVICKSCSYIGWEEELKGDNFTMYCPDCGDEHYDGTI